MSCKNGVLEGSRLDFGGPGARFWRLRAQFFQNFRMFLAECAENLPRTCRGLAQLVDAYLRSLRFCGLAPLGRDLLRGGGAAVVPPRGFQSAAHRRCAVRARSPAKSSSAKYQYQSQTANLKGQAHSARLKSYTPLFFSPQEGWDDRNPVTKFAPSAFSGLLNRFFCSPRVCFKNDFEKTSKKLRKS